MKLEEAIPIYLYFAAQWSNGTLVYDEREGKLYEEAQQMIFAEAKRLISSERGSDG